MYIFAKISGGRVRELEREALSVDGKWECGPKKLSVDKKKECVEHECECGVWSVECGV